MIANYTGNFDDQIIKDWSTQWPGHTNQAAAEAMKRELTNTEGGPILVAWESYNVQFLLEALGVHEAPEWPYGQEDEYDRLFRLEFERSQPSDPWTLKEHHIERQNFSDVVALREIAEGLSKDAQEKIAAGLEDNLDKIKNVLGGNRRLRGDRTNFV